MVDLILAFMLAACNLGQPIGNWYDYTDTHEINDLTASIRFENADGVRWLYVFRV